MGRRSDGRVASEAKRELALPEGKDRKHRQRRLPRRLPPRTHPFPAALDVDDRERAQRPPALLRQQTRQEHSTTHTRAAQQHSEARARAGTAHNAGAHRTFCVSVFFELDVRETFRIQRLDLRD